jgi:hypothetical protein
MLIRSKLHRNGGTRVELGKGREARRYHFKPLDPKEKDDDPEVEHVADITNGDDLAIFLAIKEGYEVHPSELKKPAAKAAVAVADKADEAAQAAAAAATPAGQAAATAAAVAAAKAKNYSGMQKPDLIALIVKHPKFSGKAPHGTTPTAKLIEQLERLDAA